MPTIKIGIQIWTDFHGDSFTDFHYLLIGERRRKTSVEIVDGFIRKSVPSVQETAASTRVREDQIFKEMPATLDPQLVKMNEAICSLIIQTLSWVRIWAPMCITDRKENSIAKFVRQEHYNQWKRCNSVGSNRAGVRVPISKIMAEWENNALLISIIRIN